MTLDQTPLRFAEQVFGKNQAGITDAERTRAKVVCLGIIYGKLPFWVRSWSEPSSMASSASFSTTNLSIFFSATLHELTRTETGSF